MEYYELPKPYFIDKKQSSISRRMTEHLQNGALKYHMKNRYINILTRQEIVKMSCIKKFHNVKKENIYEQW